MVHVAGDDHIGDMRLRKGGGLGERVRERRGGDGWMLRGSGCEWREGCWFWDHHYLSSLYQRGVALRLGCGYLVYC